MKNKFHFLLSVAFALVTLPGSAQVMYDWHHVTGDSTPSIGDNRIINLAVGDSGYVYVCANSHGSTDLDPGPGVVPVPNPANGEGYVAVYTATGAYVRSWCLTTAGGYSSMRKLCIAGNGDVIVVGDFRGTTDLDPGTGVTNVTSSSGDAYFARYTRTGQLLWGTSWNLPSSHRITINCVTENGGKITIGGYYSLTVNFDSVDLDPGIGVDAYSGYGNVLGYGFASRYGANGNYVWSIAYIGLGIYGIDMNAQGEIACTGGASGLVDFDPGPGTAYYTSVVSFPQFGDFFVAHYDSNGGYIWHYASGNPNQEGTGLDVCFDQSNNIYVVGLCGAPIDLDPGNPYVSVNTSGTFLAKYNWSGTFGWARNGGVALAMDANDNVYVGDNTGIECYDPGGISYWFAPVARMDGFAGAVAVAPSGKIHLAWQNYFQQDVDPGTGVINAAYSVNGSSYVVLTLTDLSTSVHQANLSPVSILYPNPCSEYVTLSGNNIAGNEVAIFNSSGRLVLRSTLSSGENRIDIRSLAPGMYFIRNEADGRSTSFVVE